MDARRKPTEATGASNGYACARGIATAEDVDATQHGKHESIRAATNIGVRLVKIASKSEVPAAEALNKVRIATPPSTGSTDKCERHAAWGCQFVTPSIKQALPQWRG